MVTGKTPFYELRLIGNIPEGTNPIIETDIWIKAEAIAKAEAFTKAKANKGKHVGVYQMLQAYATDTGDHTIDF
jgi:hypothetical protein